MPATKVHPALELRIAGIQRWPLSQGLSLRVVPPLDDADAPSDPHQVLAPETPSKTPRRLRWFAGAVVGIAGYLTFSVWKAGSPYDSPMWSPNRGFYVQKFHNFALACAPAGPGQGTDALGGYVRLYDSDGRLLEERYVSFSRDVQAVWSGKTVFLLGVPDMDDHPWQLPSSSQ